jgi:hypothetical protein
MMNSGAAIGRRWAFIKNIMWPPFSYRDALVKSALLFPEAKDVLFQLNEVDLAAHLSKHD